MASNAAPVKNGEQSVNPTTMAAWVMEQPADAQVTEASKLFATLLDQAPKQKATPSAGYVRLCGFVDQCAKSQSEALAAWASSQEVVRSLFTFYIEWSESDQHRGMKMVLDLIIQLQRRNPNKSTVGTTEKEFLDTLISILTGKSTKPTAKAAIKALDAFFAKGVYKLDDIRLAYIEIIPEARPKDELQIWQMIFQELFQWIRIHFVCPVAGKFMMSLYRGLRKQDQCVLSVDVWQQWLLDFLAHDLSFLESVKLYVFLPLFKADRGDALQFLQRISDRKGLESSENIDTDVYSLVQLAALETGKRVGLVEEPSLDVEEQPDENPSSIILHESIMHNVLAHPSHEVRMLAFSLLITSPSTTKPYSASALELLKSHIATFFAESDAKFRTDMMSKARDMFKRVRGAIAVLKRSIPRARAKARKSLKPSSQGDTKPLNYHTNLIFLPESQLEELLQGHEKFLAWYMKFLCSELIPTAAYQRHIASLKALGSILRLEGDRSKDWETPEDQELFFDLFDGVWARGLYDLVMDPFDDVRDAAAATLKAIYADGRYRRFALRECGSPVDDLHDLLLRSHELARRTSRADHADGTARVCQLLYLFSGGSEQRLALVERMVRQLEHKLSAAEADLGQAVLDEPIHGDFASLRYVWQVVSEMTFSEQELSSVQALQERLVKGCGRIWLAVQKILCDDSPEGHLPQELEEMEGLDTKSVLSYSFRSICESSNLLRTMALTVKNHTKDGASSPSAESFRRMGNLAFGQLSTLRHRGAFTAVSHAFAACCQQTKYTQYNNVDDEKSLLQLWYQGTIETIFAQASTTRRSAGIPSLMTGILSANSSQPSFRDVMDRLIEVASIEARVRETDGSNLPQVHAYNCIKDIFKNSLLTSLGNTSEQYIPQCLELAANGLKSEVWAIRNCALILLRSLIDSLLGTQESKTDAEAGWDGKANHIAYHKYPNLPGVLLNLVKSGHRMMAPTTGTSVGAESVFPALDIVRRAGPPDVLRDELQVHIAVYLASPVWHVREIAARTLCSCLLHDRWLDTIKDLIQSVTNDKSGQNRNFAHGVLLTTRFVFERLDEVASYRLSNNLQDLVASIKNADIASRYAHCPDVLAAYLELANRIQVFQMLHSQATEKFIVPTSTPCDGALLKIQRVTMEVNAASQLASPSSKLREVLIDGNNGANTISAALELFPRVWRVSSTPEYTLVELASFYMDICIETSPGDSHTVALTNLADILDHFLSQSKSDLIDFVRLGQLWGCLPFHPLNPSFSNAVLRASGSIVALMNKAGKMSESALSNWGLMVADACLDDKSFDTRFAAAESLKSFFAVSGSSRTTHAHLTATLALYDTLNDDDDEVRDAGSAAARHILGDSLVPIEAASRLLSWLSLNHSDSPALRSIVAARITGASNTVLSELPWVPAETQLDAALQVDTSLFAVEEQNLFVDEVREAKRWVDTFKSLSWEADDDGTVQRLDEWLRGGLSRLLRLLDQDDGPLGWASDPQAFAVCSRIILGSIGLMSKDLASMDVREALNKVKDKLRAPGQTYKSGLLQELIDI